MKILHTSVRKITPIFSVGKKTALGSTPARIVFKRLQQPKNAPIHAATISEPLEKHLSEALLFFGIIAASSEIQDANKNAINRNTDFSFAYAEAC